MFFSVINPNIDSKRVFVASNGRQYIWRSEDGTVKVRTKAMIFGFI